MAFPHHPTSEARRNKPPDSTHPTARYVGHKNQKYKLDCCLSERDTHVVSCSEDGKVFFWDLVEVSRHLSLLARASAMCLPQPLPGLKRAVVLGI